MIMDAYTANSLLVRRHSILATVDMIASLQPIVGACVKDIVYYARYIDIRFYSCSLSRWSVCVDSIHSVALDRSPRLPKQLCKCT
jgi:hypothetical protein